VLLNYTNPMALLVGALSRLTSIRIVGLCHSVQRTARMLARWIGAPLEEIDYTAAGINHLAWFLTFRWKGRDAYPLLRRVVLENPEVYREEIARNETFLHLGYYPTESSGHPTESSGHHSEYTWWYRKRPDLIEKIAQGTGWNPGEYAPGEGTHLEGRDSRPIGAPPDPRGPAAERGIRRAHHPRPGRRRTLPVSRQRLQHRPHSQPLPPPVAMLTRLNSEIEELAIQGALEGNPVKIFHAIAHDPLTAAVLSLEEIRNMVNELFAVHRPHLPQFSKHRVDLEDIGPHHYR